MGTMTQLESLYNGFISADGGAPHCPTLRRIASRCRHVIEIESTDFSSTVSLLAGQPKILESYRPPDFPPREITLNTCGTKLQFRAGRPSPKQLAGCDLLVVNRIQDVAKAIKDLKQDAPLIGSWIILHAREAPQTEAEKRNSLIFAINQFLTGNAEWDAAEIHLIDGGLVVLKRREAAEAPCPRVNVTPSKN